jgi:ABC-type glycerol-3-phosphate transport system permease component
MARFALRSLALPQRATGRRTILRRVRLTITVILLTLVSLLWIYPFLWMVSASLKQPLEIFTSGLSLIPQQWRWDNYARAWTNAGFGRYTFNTVLVTVGTTTLAVAQCALSGYVLGRYTFLGKRVLIAILVGTLFIPTGYTIIPLVKIADTLNILNSLWGMILVLGGAGHTTAILLFAGYFSRLPKELEEAAILDGAGFVAIFARVMLPLAPADHGDRRAADVFGDLEQLLYSAGLHVQPSRSAYLKRRHAGVCRAARNGLVGHGGGRDDLAAADDAAVPVFAALLYRRHRWSGEVVTSHASCMATMVPP